MTLGIEEINESVKKSILAGPSRTCLEVKVQEQTSGKYSPQSTACTWEKKCKAPPCLLNEDSSPEESTSTKHPCSFLGNLDLPFKIMFSLQHVSYLIVYMFLCLFPLQRSPYSLLNAFPASMKPRLLLFSFSLIPYF